MTFTVPTTQFTPPDADTYLQQVLDSYGLGSLTPWAWGQIATGQSPDQVTIAIRQTPEWQQRFGAIVKRQQLGLPALSEAQVIAYEDQATQVLRAAGIPAGFYDQPQDFVDLIGNDVSINEFTQRIDSGFQKVANTSPAVLAAAEDYFGADSRTALAMIYLDPQRAQAQLQQMSDAATFGGIGRQQGFAIPLDVATEAAQAGVSGSAAQTGFTKLADQRAYQTGTIAEGTDISDAQAAQAQFGLDPTAAAAMLARQQERDAQFRGVAPAPGLSQQGVTGLGETKQGAR